MSSTNSKTHIEVPAATETTEVADGLPPVGLVERIDLFRAEATRSLDPTRRAEMGQFLTPPAIARFMASLFSDPIGSIRLLDAGAGIGTLTAAFVEDVCTRRVKTNQIDVVVYELDPLLADCLGTTLSVCCELCAQHGIRLSAEVRQADFVVEGVAALRKDLFASELKGYNRAILNPPYRKIRSDSEYRTLLREIGVETSNLYTAFLALVIELLEPDGELVAITPRSFCNGPYFRPFRKQLLEKMAIRRVHVFESRGAAFSDDEVLQENIILHAVKHGTRDRVILSRAHGPNDDTLTVRDAPYDEVVHPDDADLVIRIPTTDMEALVKDRMGVFEHTLEVLGLEVSTGRVVDFRAREMLRSEPAPDTVPLIYPGHLDHGSVRWPDPKNRKVQAILASPMTQPLFLPAGCYVLVKRFTSKEERRRVVAAVFDGDRVQSRYVAFENHLNVFHIGGAGLPIDLARGLALFLNSTLLDVYFRQFSGHTQVNATDLRSLRYPSRQALERLGQHAGTNTPSQRQIDQLVEEEVLRMTDIQSPNPIAAKEKISEAIEILRSLGLPRGQLNDRSALTLLALVELQPEMTWSQASNPRIGITPIMDFCRDYYGTKYAPNTRETFRKQTMHQFVEACLAVVNPDQPDRATNSPKWCYQVETRTLRLLKAFGTAQWEPMLAEWRASVESLK
jgi:adenine-specific DNA-methyltransferase